MTLRAQGDSMVGTEEPALGGEERSDEVPGAGAGARRTPVDPEVVAKPTWRSSPPSTGFGLSMRRTAARAPARSDGCFAVRGCTPRICRRGARRGAKVRCGAWRQRNAGRSAPSPTP